MAAREQPERILRGSGVITLIHPPGIKTFSGLQMLVPNPPLGLAYVAAAVKRAGLAYRVIDATGDAPDSVSRYPARDDFMVQGFRIEEILERVPAETDIIGVACMFSALWPLTKRMAEALRARFPKALFVLGGEHGTATYGHVLTHSPFDVVVLGEGQDVFVDLVRAYRGGAPLRPIQGLAYRENGSVIVTGLAARRRDVDAIAPPDWDSFPLEEYVSRHQLNGVNLGRSMPLLATWGCPYECVFCSNPNMWTRRYIMREPSLVVDEMELYTKKFKVTNFDFQDLTAIVNRRWAIDFCREILRRGLKITWQMPSGTRSEVFDGEVADYLYRSGCRALAFAPESGSPEILRKVKKQVQLDKMLESMRIAVKRGIKLSCYLVIGFPDDTPKTLHETLTLIRKMAVIGVHDIAVSKFVPYPGSELFFRLQREGKIQLDDEFFVSPMDFYTQKAPSYAPAVSTSRLYWTMIWMFVNFYAISFALRPMRVIRILVKALFTGMEETRYAKWFVDRVFVRRRWRQLAARAS